MYELLFNRYKDKIEVQYYIITLLNKLKKTKFNSKINFVYWFFISFIFYKDFSKIRIEFLILFLLLDNIIFVNSIR